MINVSDAEYAFNPAKRLMMQAFSILWEEAMKQRLLSLVIILNAALA
jgi:hypothetical protein